jgi:hypothetical protein
MLVEPHALHVDRVRQTVALFFHSNERVAWVLVGCSLADPLISFLCALAVAISGLTEGDD